MKTVKSPLPLRTTEREFEEAFAAMIDLMSRIYRKQVIEAMQAGTVEKFADAQKGNFASIFLKLAGSVSRRIKARFSNDRIKKVVTKYLQETNKRNQKKLYSQIESSVGVDAKRLVAEEGLKANTNALILETSEWAKKLRDETLETYTANSLRVMTLGSTLEQVLAEFDGLKEKRRDQAKFTARNQINNFNSVMTKVRAQNIGITKAIWQTSEDERVRDSHRQRNGKEFDLAKGLYSSLDGETALPGVPYQCRCTYILVIPDDDE